MIVVKDSVLENNNKESEENVENKQGEEIVKPVNEDALKNDFHV